MPLFRPPGPTEIDDELAALRALASRLPDDFPLDPHSFLSGMRYALLWTTGATDVAPSSTLGPHGPLTN